ncbi:hypothetical protein [Enhygromyxa salina]|uniref:Uncharacterized protein n=1 Tax=Enhygromyxa salina TaxID=215803 RepID=A0A2S9YVY1_9BACT|nr:hypothetical protein [Enhygromyxa salina]PRQ09240.1 hypothetical protein ENSA7_12300 [Enhygromyxa salina]
MSEAEDRSVKSFEVYRRDNGRTAIVRTLHHNPYSGRTWVTEVHEKSGAGDSLRIETSTELEDMDPEDRALYQLRLHKELAAEQATMPPV